MSNASAPAQAPETVVKNRKLGTILVVVAIVMTLFGPFLYYTGSLLCDYLGVGVNPGGDPDADGAHVLSADAESAVQGADGELFVRTVFAATTDRELEGRVEFTVDNGIQNHQMGGLTTNTFQLTNTTAEPLYILPIHSVVPNKAAANFIMAACFCFKPMEIQPGEQHELTLIYGFKPELGTRVPTAQVAYDLRRITREEFLERSAEVEAKQAEILGDEGAAAAAAQQERQP